MNNRHIEILVFTDESVHVSYRTDKRTKDQITNEAKKHHASANQQSKLYLKLRADMLKEVHQIDQPVPLDSVKLVRDQFVSLFKALGMTVNNR